MRLLSGLHCIRLRKTKTVYGKRDEHLYAHTYDALAWRPGSEGDDMWAAHTEAVFRQRYAERLTRGESNGM